MDASGLCFCMASLKFTQVNTLSSDVQSQISHGESCAFGTQYGSVNCMAKIIQKIPSKTAASEF